MNQILRGKATIYSRSQLTSHNLQDLCIDFFLFKSQGILHIGAFDGNQFAKHYNLFGRPVIWIEANDKVFPLLEKNISHFPNQRAYNLLLGSSNQTVQFYEMTNLGSSSIFPINSSSPWGIKTELSKELQMTRLSDNFTKDGLKHFDFWVIDTQGSELEILKGAEKLLASVCKYLYVEVSNNSPYLGGSEHAEVENFLANEGFVAAWEFSGFHGDVLYINSQKLGKSHLISHLNK